VADYRDIRAYREAKSLARDLYRVTASLPFYLRWRLGGQLDASAESIGSNLAEGEGRKNAFHANTELIRYVHMALGSANETEHRIGGLHDRGLMTEEDFAHFGDRIDKVRRMLRAFIRELRRLDRGRREE
jgi:four helix bundle protein